MKHITIYLLPIILLLSGCGSDHETFERSQESNTNAIQTYRQQSTAVIDLDDLVTKIVDLIKKNSVAEILIPDIKQSQSITELLVKNFSPAEMAFDLEVLNYNDLAIVLFYDESQPLSAKLQELFEKSARANNTKAKFVKVEAAKLFKLADQAMITGTPTVVAIKFKKELGRIELSDLSLLETQITSLLDSIEPQERIS